MSDALARFCRLANQGHRPGTGPRPRAANAIGLLLAQQACRLDPLARDGLREFLDIACTFPHHARNLVARIGDDNPERSE